MKITQSGLSSTGKWDYFQGKERVTSSAVSSGLSVPHIMPILCLIMWICSGAIQGLQQAMLKQLGLDLKALPILVLSVFIQRLMLVLS